MSDKQDKIVYTIMIICGILIGLTVMTVGPSRIIEEMENQYEIQVNAMKMREEELLVNRAKHVMSKKENPNWLEDSIYTIELAIRNKELENLSRGIAQIPNSITDNTKD